MMYTRLPLRTAFGTLCAAYFGAARAVIQDPRERKKRLMIAGGGVMLAALLLRSTTGKVGAGPLLLTPKSVVFARSLCTSAAHASMVVYHALPAVAGCLTAAVALTYAVRRGLQMRDAIAEERLAIYRLVVDQFEDCPRCSHMATCSKSSYEKLDEAARRCAHDLGVDLNHLRREASRCLRHRRQRQAVRAEATPQRAPGSAAEVAA